MKKLVIAVIGVACIVGGLVFLRYNMSGGQVAVAPGADLVVVNDTTDTVSSEYTHNGKIVANVIKPNEHATGGKGLMRIFTPKKIGLYEIEYVYPRPAGKPGSVALSAVMQAAKKEHTGDNLYTKKGMIDDVRISYEEVEQE